MSSPSCLLPVLRTEWLCSLQVGWQAASWCPHPHAASSYHDKARESNRLLWRHCV